jgi:uncharacterized protein (DUF983 family)
MKKNRVQASTLLSLLTMIFIALKIIGIISWSWWWVFSPAWIPLTVALLLSFVVVAIAIRKAIKIPLAKGENLDRIAEAHGLERGFMESDIRLRRRIIENIRR